jgi:hypothetical protein
MVGVALGGGDGTGLIAVLFFFLFRRIIHSQGKGQVPSAAILLANL